MSSDTPDNGHHAAPVVAPDAIGSDSPALLIVGHGTRDNGGVEEFLELERLIQARVPQIPVGAGFIELSKPPISEVVSGLVEGGSRQMIAVPLMLLTAGHAKNDIPATLVRERLAHPGVSITYSRALGVRTELLELLDERIEAALDGRKKEQTAVLLVGRGSSDPDANSDLAKIARLFSEGRSYPLVDYGFVSLAPPSVKEALERCRLLGAKQVVVVPYFLFTGVLERRIREQATEFAKETGLDVFSAGYMGPDDRVIDLVLERYREAIEGDVRMNCDVCIHRVALPGFEESVGAVATPHYHPDEDGDGHSHGHGHGHSHDHPHADGGQ